MMKKRLLHLVAAMLILTLVSNACGSSETVDVGDAQPGTTAAPSDDASSGSGTRPTLKGIWVLRSFTLDGVDVPLPDDTIDMEIELGRIGGTGGCNSFGGQIDAADDGGLTITDMAWTEMACAEPGRMAFESSYLPALAGVAEWNASPDGITFSSDSAVLTFEPGEPPTTLPFENTTWTFDTIFSGSGVERAASTTDQSKSEVTAVIADGAVTLTADDCGPISLRINHEDGSDGNLNVVDKDTADKPSCADPTSNMTAAIAGFWDATGFMVNESRMTLIGLPGELISFRANS